MQIREETAQVYGEAPDDIVTQAADPDVESAAFMLLTGHFLT